MENEQGLVSDCGVCSLDSHDQFMLTEALQALIEQQNAGIPGAIPPVIAGGNSPRSSISSLPGRCVLFIR